jgi:hypothetical protein
LKVQEYHYTLPPTIEKNKLSKQQDVFEQPSSSFAVKKVPWSVKIRSMGEKKHPMESSPENSSGLRWFGDKDLIPKVLKNQNIDSSAKSKDNDDETKTIIIRSDITDKECGELKDMHSYTFQELKDICHVRSIPTIEIGKT